MPRYSNDYPPSGWSSPAPAWVVWLVWVVMLAGSIFLTWRLWPTSVPVGNDPTAAPRAIAPPGVPTTEEQRRIEIFSKAKLSVVNISTAQLLRDRLSLDLQRVPKGSGTGFIWDEKGRVVTNYHVVKEANQVRVTLDDHSVASVYDIRFDEGHDLAVLITDIPPGKRKPIPVGESSKLQVGQSVLAIGNPFGLDHSLSAGIISALGRDMKTEDGQVNRGLIQTDAAINPGNSGGPLLDSSGRLIGVNAAIISPSGASVGIGFAIPVDMVNRVVPRLIQGVKEARPGLGIVEAPDQWAKQRDITGVLVINVIPDGPADKAKIHPTYRDDSGKLVWGDIITGIDKHKVTSANELYAILDTYKVGQEVTVHLLRDGKNEDVKVTLAPDALTVATVKTA